MFGIYFPGLAEIWSTIPRTYEGIPSSGNALAKHKFGMKLIAIKQTTLIDKYMEKL